MTPNFCSILFCFWLVCICAVSGVSWKKCLNGTSMSVCVCGGSQNGFSKWQRAYEKLKTIYENCTKVLGNLEITYLSSDISGDPLDLSFLSSIEEVSGYVLIGHNNALKNISLPNLRIIRGEELFKDWTADPNYFSRDGYGLTLFENSNLQYLSMPKLRTIQNGKIFVKRNPQLCYWRTIDWSELISEETKADDILDTDMNNNICHPYVCHNNCWNKYTGKKHCWGPMEEMCQDMYRSMCVNQCTTGMCFKPGSQDYCCHTACIAGCTGPTNKDCTACAEVENEGKCVHSCPVLKIYDKKEARVVQNPNGKYRFKNLCVKECPVDLYVHSGMCVSKCPDNYYVSNDGDESIEKAKECKECPSSGCPKTCISENGEWVNGNNIWNFANCTIIHGSIEILAHSFQEQKDFQKNITNRFALEITGNLALTYLGLASLKRISDGDVLISENIDLCYVDSIPWSSEIVVHGSHVIRRNRDRALCKREKKFCDKLCEPSKGCWGPGSGLCYECKNWLLGKDCVETCTAEDGFYAESAKVCKHCHPQCSQCEGPGPTNCTRCRNMKLGDMCVESCPENSHYEQGGVCYECHKNCFDYGCTGNGNFVGRGGCNKCKFAVATEDSRDVKYCLPEYSSLENICLMSNLTNYYQSVPQYSTNLKDKVAYYVCEKCAEECLSCKAYGTLSVRHNCTCKNFKVLLSAEDTVQYRMEYSCAMKCPHLHFVKEEPSAGKAGVCVGCHKECKEGCYGKLATQCSQCLNFEDPISGDASAGFTCVKICPPQRPFHENHICQEKDPIWIKEQEGRKRTIFIGLVVLPLVFLLLLFAACCFTFRRKFQNLKNLFWSPDLPLEAINPDAKPNMTQLRLIKEDELRQGQVLGNGAFGVVFNGMWIPTGENIKVPVAIKELQRTRMVAEKMEKGAEREMLDEAGIMAQMDHPNLVRLVGICLGSKKMMLVTPLMPLGNLLEYVQNNKARIGSAALLRWCTQIASGMEYLEENRLVHRDLAARNVLVQTPYHVRVTDFGLAKMLDYGEVEIFVEGRVPVKWLALECIQYKRFTHKSDVWAFGVTVWELLEFGKKPYENTPITQIPQLLERGERLLQPRTCTHDVHMVLISCWMVDASSRPTFNELKEKFLHFSRDPARYLVIDNDKLLRLPSCTSQDQQNLIRHMWSEDGEENENFVNPHDYFDSSIAVSTPSSPISPSKPLMSNGVHNRQTRHSSVGSHRYQSDPLKHLPPHAEEETSSGGFVVMNPDGKGGVSFHGPPGLYPPLFPADMDNYLIPDSKQQQANGYGNLPSTSGVAYTPVVTGPVGNELYPPPTSIKPPLYYNDLPVIGAMNNKYNNNENNYSINKKSLADNSVSSVSSDSSRLVDNIEYLQPKNGPSKVAGQPDGLVVNETETTV